MNVKKSPRIDNKRRGRVQVEGYSKHFKDVKLYPGGAREWDWRETGTRHKPGIQPDDVQELLDHGADVVILSTGMQERLKVSSPTIQMLAEKNVEALVLNTKEAVERYNELRESIPVAALIHSTC